MGRTISSGVTEMEFAFTGSYQYLSLDFGTTTNASRVSKIEVITDHSNGFYTNQDVNVYVSSSDGVYYSFNGGNYQSSNKTTLTANGSNYSIKVKDSAGNVSEETKISINNIDKDKPSCEVIALNEPADGWYIQNASLSLKTFDEATSIDSPVSGVSDYGLATSTTPTYNNKTTGVQSEVTNGTTWYGYVRDKAGNSNVCSKVIKKKKEEKYAIYSETDKSLRFVLSLDEIKVGDTYNGRVVTAVYTGFESNSYYSDTVPWKTYIGTIEKVIVETNVKPVSLSYWFRGMKKCSYLDVSKIDTSNITSMSYLFYETGYNVSSFEIVGLEDWDVSKVTDMVSMFNLTGYKALIFDIGDVGNWDTSNVNNMLCMFSDAGYSATTWNVGNLSNWDVSKVTDMGGMFWYAGFRAITFNIGNLNNWDTSNVIYMGGLFGNAGRHATTWNIGNLSDWDVSSVTAMYNMFYCAGGEATTFSIGNLGNWDVSSVSNMSSMFGYAGRYATTFNIGDLSNWDVSNVIYMSYMFDTAGYNAAWSLNLSEWEVGKVTAYEYFNKDVESKVIPPVWVN
jgi:hypothetical protein